MNSFIIIQKGCQARLLLGILYFYKIFRYCDGEIPVTDLKVREK